MVAGPFRQHQTVPGASAAREALSAHQRPQHLCLASKGHTRTRQTSRALPSAWWVAASCKTCHSSSKRLSARWNCLPDVHCFILTNAGHGLRTRNAHPTQTPARGGSKKRGKRGAATDGPESNSHWYLWSSVSYASSRVEFSALVNSRVCGFHFFLNFCAGEQKTPPYLRDGSPPSRLGQ